MTSRNILFLCHWNFAANNYRLLGRYKTKTREVWTFYSYKKNSLQKQGFVWKSLGILTLWTYFWSLAMKRFGPRLCKWFHLWNTRQKHLNMTLKSNIDITEPRIYFVHTGTLQAISDKNLKYAGLFYVIWGMLQQLNIVQVMQ